MSYTKITNFAIKDTYLTGNPAKIVKGVEIDAEFDAIAAEDALNLKDADVQTSSVDTTAGRLLTVGAFGLGALGNAAIISNIDDTASLPSGLARAQVATTGTKPTGAASNGQVFTERFSTTILKQTWTDVTGGSTIAPRTWVRTSSAVNTWGAWTEEFNAASTRLAYGVTPSPWGAGGGIVDMGTSSLVLSNYAQLGVNFYNDGANVRYKASAAAVYVANIGVFGTAFGLARAAAGTAGNIVTLNSLFQVDDNGVAVVQSPTGGIGYGTGAGGTVTQLTSKSTAVTLNKPCGQITMHNAALGASARTGFGLVNSTIAATDTVIVNVASSESYRVEVARVSAAYAAIFITNMTGGSLSEAVVINFTVIKGVAS